MEWNSVSNTTLSVSSDVSEVQKSDLIILGLCGSKDGINEVLLEGITKSIDKDLEGCLTSLLEEQYQTFKNGSKLGTITPTVRVVGPNPKRYTLLGLGSPKTESGETVDYKGEGFVIGKAIATACGREKRIVTATVVLPHVLASSASFIQDFTTSFYQSMYSDNRYRTGEKIKKPDEFLKNVIIISENGEVDISSVQAAIEIGRKIALGVILAKDIVNAPHNVLNSETLAETAQRVATHSNGRLTCVILEQAECEKLGMGCYLAVARGSETRPQFVHMTYTPPSGVVKSKIGLVGKGVTFDTGGYNIKTSLMEWMKFDCGGAAAVIGAARSIAYLEPEGVEVHFFVPACENMINEKAYVPSDVLTAMNGKTVEVMNTDAEGRLTLADAICYADTVVGCEKIIELSTLTGAAIAFLGQRISGFWTDDDTFAKLVEEASKVSTEKAWRMPLEKEYADQLDSIIADMKNLGGRWGGPILAALFLTNFVDPKKPFVHVDMAGPVWNEKSGATGWGSSLLTTMILLESKQLMQT